MREIAIAQARRDAAAHAGRVPRGERGREPPPPFRKDWAGRSLEGFLFPATYEFTKLTTSQQLVRDQLERFARAAGRKVDLRYARSKNLTPYDVLIIASMIEKETVVPEERRLVAAVIYNRLQGAGCRSGSTRRSGTGGTCRGRSR